VTEEAILYRELFSFLSAPTDAGRPVPFSARDLPRPLARGLVHFYGLLRSETVRAIDEDLADQIARSLSDWFAQLYRQLWSNTDSDARSATDELPEDPAALVAVLTARWPDHARQWERSQRTIAATPDQRVCEMIRLSMVDTAKSLALQQREQQTERALRLVTAPLADHLNETVPSIVATARRVNAAFHRPGVWNIFDPLWNEVDWEPIENAAETGEQEPDLAALAQRLVRGVEPVSERQVWQEETVTVVHRDARDSGYGNIERLGTTGSPQLALSSELSLLASPETEELFLRKQAEGAILALEPTRYEYSERIDLQTRWRRVDAPQRLGPIIVCVDTSGSMQGEAGEIAAATTLLIVREALHQRRPVDVVAVHETLRIASFLSSPTSEPATTETAAAVNAEEPDRVEPEPVMHLESILTPASPGGANISPALEEAIDRAESRARRGHDIVDLLIVSDIRFPKVGPNHLNRIYRLQSRGWARIHALTINREPIHDPLNVFDYRWHYNTADEFDFRNAGRPHRIGIARSEI
jgi:uncharacterized protein with von Willebrand factor type A (vWA) domain